MLFRSEKIRRLEQAVAAERPSEAFDFGSQKFPNALKLIETGGKNLPEDVQRIIASQFRYCPDALNVLSPLIDVYKRQSIYCSHCSTLVRTPAEAFRFTLNPFAPMP